MTASRRALLALALYRLAEFGPWVAILVYAYRQGGATATGLVSFGLLVPTAVCSPLAGPAIDRFGATRVLQGAYAAQAGAMACTAAALLADAPPAVVYVLAAVTAILINLTHPAHAVASPALARTTEELVRLNAATGWVLSVGLFVAPALAGALLGVAGPGAVYLAGAASLAVSALLVAPLRSLVPPLPREGATTIAAELRRVVDGGRALVHSRSSREVVLLAGASFAMVGAFDVLAVSLALGHLDLGASGAGYLTASHGAGATIGAIASLALVGRTRLVPVVLAAALASGLGFAVLGLSTTVVVAFGVAGLAGCSRSLLEVTSQTLLQRVTPTAELAQVFAFKEGVAMAAWAIGSALVPLLVALGGTTAAILGTGLIVPFVVVVRLRPLLLLDAAATVPVVALALLRRLPIFRALPVPAIEGVASHAAPIEAAPGAAIVREDEHGSRYYAIVDGTVEVSARGVRRRQLGRGEGFGEIALLRDGVRTATVVALDAVHMLAIEREAFLVAVTGHGETRERAESIAAAHLAAPT